MTSVPSGSTESVVNCSTRSSRVLGGSGVSEITGADGGSFTSRVTVSSQVSSPESVTRSAITWGPGVSVGLASTMPPLLGGSSFSTPSSSEDQRITRSSAASSASATRPSRSTGAVASTAPPRGPTISQVGAVFPTSVTVTVVLALAPAGSRTASVIWCSPASASSHRNVVFPESSSGAPSNSTPPTSLLHVTRSSAASVPVSPTTPTSSSGRRAEAVAPSVG